MPATFQKAVKLLKKLKNADNSAKYFFKIRLKFSNIIDKTYKYGSFDSIKAIYM